MTVAGPSRTWLRVYLKGVFMGAADSVPGVSGGTIALITGIYERLIGAITAADPTDLWLLTGVHTAEGRAALRERLVEIDLPFLLVLGLGIVTAIVSVSRVVHVALGSQRALTFAFFFGLIAASAIVLYTEVDVGSPGRLAVAVAGFLFAFVVSGVTSGGSLPHTLPIVAAAGSVAVTAMILPGISGAFILLLLGQYEYLTGVLSAFVDALVGLVNGGSLRSVTDPAATVVAFGLGGVVGLLSVAYLIRWALANYRAATLAFLVSLMVGALRLPAIEVLGNTASWTPPTIGATLLAGGLGAGLVLALDRYTDDLEY